MNDPSRMGWESLVMELGVKPVCSLDVIFSTYRVCFEGLERPLLGPWRVSRGNERMMEIHQRMGFTEIVKTDSLFWWLVVTSVAYEKRANRFLGLGLGDLGRWDEQYV